MAPGEDDVSLAAVEGSAQVAARPVSIDPWNQLVYSFRTHVNSTYHNVCAAVAETFGVQWRPTEERVWLLGRRYRAPAAEPPFLGGGGGSSPSVPRRRSACAASGAVTGVGAAGGAECGDGASEEGSEGGDGEASPTSPTGDDGRRPRWRSLGSSWCAEDGPEGLYCVDGDGESEAGSPEEFEAAWVQIMRMTYRKGFAPMYRCVGNPNGGSERRYIRLTSDAGWGCMIRVGQMLLATALKRHYAAGDLDDRGAGGGPKAAAGGLGDFGEAAQALDGQFLDEPCALRCPFSIFGFIRTAHGREVAVPPSDEDEVSGTGAGGPAAAEASGRTRRHTRQLTHKLPGDWFGPTTISETIAALVENNGQLREHLAVYVDADGTLYEDEVRALGGCSSAGGSASCSASSCSGIGSAAPAAVNGDGAVGATAGGFWSSSAVGDGGSPLLLPLDFAAARGDAGQPGTSGPAVHKDSGDWESEFMVVGPNEVIFSPGTSPLLSPALVPYLKPAQMQSPYLVPMDSCGMYPEGDDVDFELRSLEPLPPPSLPLDHSGGGGFDGWLGDGVCSLPPTPQNKLAACEPSFKQKGVRLPVPASSGEASSGIPCSTSTATTASTERWSRAVLLLFPLQLGLEKYVCESNVTGLLRYFELRASLGAMGGRPRMAHFFVGRQGRGLLYVDPHVVQPAAVEAPSASSSSSSPAPPLAPPSAGAAVAATGGTGEDASSSGGVVGELGGSGGGGGPAPAEPFRNISPVQIIPIEHIDSSISVAFYVRSEAEFAELLAGLRDIDATEANAAIRVETTRPPRLRLPESDSIFSAYLEADTDLSFTEVQRREGLLITEECGEPDDSDAASQNGQGLLINEECGEPDDSDAASQQGKGDSRPDANPVEQPETPAPAVVAVAPPPPKRAPQISMPGEDDGAWGGVVTPASVALAGPGGKAQVTVCSPWADGPWADIDEVEAGGIMIGAYS